LNLVGLAIATVPLMKISIVTPVYNGSSHLECLLKYMSLQGESLEHILQIHRSDAASYKIALRFRDDYDLKFFFEDDTGLYDAICKGFRKASGDVIGWLGVDDVYFQNAISAVAGAFKQHPSILWLTGVPCHMVESIGHTTSICPRFVRIHPRILIKHGAYKDGGLGSLQQESMFWRKELWLRSGGEETLRAYRYASDYWLWRSFAAHTPLFVMCAPLAAFSIRAGQISDRHRLEYQAECGKGFPLVLNFLCYIFVLLNSVFPGPRLIKTPLR